MYDAFGFTQNGGEINLLGEAPHAVWLSGAGRLLFAGNKNDPRGFATYVENFYGGLEDAFDLRLMSSVNDVNIIPTVGKNLIIVAAVNNVLRFRIFDGDGKEVVDTDENRLKEEKPQIGQQIEDLRKRLESLWPPHQLTSGDTIRVITDVRSIVVHIQEDSAEEIVLETHPRWVDNGWIRGEFYIPYIKSGHHFLAKIGFIKPIGEPRTNGVTVKIRVNCNIIYEEVKRYDGKLKNIDVDLSKFDKQSGTLLLEIGTNGDSTQDWLVWINPRIGFP